MSVSGISTALGRHWYTDMATALGQVDRTKDGA